MFLVVSYYVDSVVIFFLITDLLEVYKEYIPIFNLWADAESKLADPLHAMASAFDKNTSALKSLASIFSQKYWVIYKLLVARIR